MIEDLKDFLNDRFIFVQGELIITDGSDYIDAEDTNKNTFLLMARNDL